eukprot:CCRYP_007531-RA/>CCRYP_007531-RA protein AED:0.05 eAED:0.04 QI:0/0/0/1/0.33/0.25/4/0/510
MSFVSAAWRTISHSSERKEREKELKQLKKSIKKTMRVQKREVMGLGDILFTVGGTETAAFAEKNDLLREQGESYYLRVKNDISSKEQVVVLWVKLVAHKDEFITDLKLGSTRPNHEHFFFGDKEGYQIIAHPRLRGMGAAASSLCLWYKKEINKSRHICDLKISYTKENQIDLIRKNYEMLPFCLSKFGCAYANIWILWTSKDIVRLTDSAHIEKELQDYSAMLKASPNDPMLIKMVEAANQRLREAQLREEDHAKDIPFDDLVYTKQFLALKRHELDKMKSVFQRSIDFDRDGKISVEDYAMFLGEPLSMASFIRQIFALSSNGRIRCGKNADSNTTPMMNVGSTLKATAVFCMLCSTELLKFIFSSYDEEGYGYIDNGEFRQLLASFHPRHSDEHVTRALKEFDLPTDGIMPFDTFVTLVKKLPHLMYPAFRVQEKMRKKFMGVPFWRRKLERYEEAKKLLNLEEEKLREAERMDRQKRDDFADDWNIDTIDVFVEKSKRENRRRQKR